MIYSEEFGNLGGVNLEIVPDSQSMLDEVVEQRQKLFDDYCECLWLTRYILENEIDMTTTSKLHHELLTTCVWFEGEYDDLMEDLPYHYDGLCGEQEQLLTFLRERGGEYHLTRTRILSHYSRPGHHWEFRHVL